MKGVVRKWNPERRFGFVRADDGRVCFLHLGEIVGNIQPLQIGTRLEFDVEEGPQGLVAVNVSSTGRDASPMRATTHRGTVTHFHAARGFGNIRPNEGNVLQSIFFHARQVQYRDIAAGDLVEFDVGHDLRGRPAAINVRRIAPGQSQREAGKSEWQQAP